MREKIEGREKLEEYAKGNLRGALINIEKGFPERALRFLEAAMEQVKERVQLDV